MALRMIEVAVPAGDSGEVLAILAEEKVLGTWVLRPAGNDALVRFLVDASRAEAISDLMSQRFSARAGFHLVVLPVDAALPAPESPPDVIIKGRRRHALAPRISRDELYQVLSDSAHINWVFIVAVALSTIVAAIGLVRGDVAVIIGAMVIAPLLGPNMALTLASTLGDEKLAWRSLRAIAAGIGVALVLSILLGWLLHVDPAVDEIQRRTHVDLADIVLALAAGSAGALAFTTGLPAAVIGVMVAVAVLPPVVAAGLMIGSGEFVLAAHAVTLAVTNVTCINLAGVATFLVQRVRPRTWWEAERARRATRLAVGSWLAMLAILIVLLLRHGV